MGPEGRLGEHWVPMILSLSIAMITSPLQLLWHRTVAETLGQDCVDNLVRWIKEPSLIMKEIGLRGISNLALHPKHVRDWEDWGPVLVSEALDPPLLGLSVAHAFVYSSAPCPRAPCFQVSIDWSSPPRTFPFHFFHITSTIPMLVSLRCHLFSQSLSADTV
jgi:hypothetical protein